MTKISFLSILLLCVQISVAQLPVKPLATTIDGRNVDSMAIWIAPKKADSLVLLTEKAGGEVMVFKADSKATFIRRFGEFKRPNAVVIAQKVKIGNVKARDLAFITERDGNRISIYSVPEFEKLGEFGTDVPQPMGITLFRKNKRELIAFVVAKRATGNDKIIRFKIKEEQGRLTGVRETQFGKELTPNQETVFVDERRMLLYAADETARDIKVYDFDGNLRKTFGDGAFEAQVEGISLARCRRTDYLIASDQRETTEFEVFDLNNYRHVGTVLTTARRTDGIALTQTELPDYPRGLFIAQTDPQGTGGLRAEFFDLNALLERAGVKDCK